MSSINSQSSEEIKSKSKSISSPVIDELFLEKLDEYYRLKNKYDTKIKEKKNSILKDDNLSMKQKREKYGQAKFKCINCSRNVNTIFDITDGILTAVCGDKKAPCKLNIKINRGKYLDIRKLMDVFQNGVDVTKEEIIAAKLDLLFGYENESDTLKKFKGLKKELTDDLEALAEYKTGFIDTIYNLKNKDSLQAKMTLFYQHINTIKDTVKEYNETGIIHLIKDVISLYQTEMKPLLVDINRLEYKNKSIEYNESQNNYQLKRDTYTLSNLLVPFSYPKIESFELYTSIDSPSKIDNESDDEIDYSKLREENAKLSVDDFDSDDETKETESKKVTIKEINGEKRIFLGDDEIINKMDFDKNATIYSDAPDITGVEANKLGYIMEMINTSANKPQLVAIDTSNGMIYKVDVSIREIPNDSDSDSESGTPPPPPLGADYSSDSESGTPPPPPLGLGADYSSDSESGTPPPPPPITQDDSPE